MDKNLFEELKKLVKNNADEEEQTLRTFSHDASIFEVNPRVVVFPTNKTDIENVIKFVNLHKKENPTLSITARSAGTDMSGGALNDSIVLSFTEHLHKIIGLNGNVVTAEPGVFYRDFEKYTLKSGLIFPSYPSSREICALGGIVNNNAGGEKSFEYGKTEDYVRKLKIVLSDGNEYEFEPLSDKKLQEKLMQNNFEGSIYQKMYALITKNYEEIMKAKPNVSKNSSGYYLWNVYDKEKKIFDLTKLFVGAQGTLGIMTEASIALEPVKKYSEMLIAYLFEKDLDKLGDIVNAVIPLKPESFETYDDTTLKLAVKYFHEFAKKMHTNILSAAFHFIPELLMVYTNRVPKLFLQIEFTGNNQDDLNDKIKNLKQKLKPFNISMRTSGNATQSKKYWLIRRESFNLLREKIKDKHSAPFIDDIVVRPERLPEFLPKLNAIIAKYPSIISTLAGHMGNGNFHIIPLMDLHEESQREIIPKLSKEVFDLVFEYKGSTSGEHNDGLVRSMYLKQMFGEKIYELFEQTKKIFDPQNIFNPRKKVNSSMDYSMKHIRTNW